MKARAFSAIGLAILGSVVLWVVMSRSALRVCADPNNLPFSNDRLEGFENRLAEALAEDLNRSLEYFWWAQRRGFIRNTLNADACDVVMGVPRTVELAQTSDPYYRSTYVFLWKRERHLQLASLDDPQLSKLRIGVEMIGDDFANSPPAHALRARGLTANVVGYSGFGDYRQPNPPASIVEAVVRDEVDAALVWGPLAGYFAARQAVPLNMSAVTPHVDRTLPFEFDISMAVRRHNDALLSRVNEFISRRRAIIDDLLRAYHVPRTDLMEHAWSTP